MSGFLGGTSHSLFGGSGFMGNTGSSTPPFDPTQIGGLTAWYRADKLATLSGSNVIAWGDSSGTGVTAKNLTATNPHYPTYNTTDASYNNQATMSYLRSIGQFFHSTSFSLPQPYTVFVAGNYDGTGANQTFISGFGEYNLLETSENPSGGPNLYAGATLQAGVSLSSAPSIFIGEFNGATSKMYVSQLTANVTGNTGATNATGISVGAQFNNAATLNGKIAEVIVYSGILSLTDRTSVTNYLNTRYAIPLIT